eukprot:2420151-Pleurochrysis_carterae.AAC.2
MESTSCFVPSGPKRERRGRARDGQHARGNDGCVLPVQHLRHVCALANAPGAHEHRRAAARNVEIEQQLRAR